MVNTALALAAASPGRSGDGPNSTVIDTPSLLLTDRAQMFAVPL
jgi:hypothetical protein